MSSRAAEGGALWLQHFGSLFVLVHLQCEELVRRPPVERPGALAAADRLARQRERSVTPLGAKIGARAAFF